MTVLPFQRRAPPPIVESDNDDLVVTIGSIRSALNLTTAKVIKATPGRLCRAVIIRRGTGGTFTLNDAATLDAASAENTVCVIPSGVIVGSIIILDWPMSAGITLSAVPAGGIIAVSYC